MSSLMEFAKTATTTEKIKKNTTQCGDFISERASLILCTYLPDPFYRQFFFCDKSQNVFAY